MTAIFKAACQNPWLVELDACQQNFLWVTGYSPIQWQRGNDLIMYKEAGNYNTQQTRPILIFEVDINQHNKNLGCLVMHTAEQWGGLPDLEIVRK